MVINNDGEYISFDIHELYDLWQFARSGEKVGLRRKLHIWLLEQSIFESPDVELDMKHIHFLAEFVGMTKPVSEYKKGIRGYVIMYGKDKVELTYRYESFDVMFYTYEETPDLMGPKYMIANIHLSEEARKFMEEKFGSPHWSNEDVM